MLIRKHKEKGKSGFTLAELLVVVAIIAILVAVSIPIFTGKLEKTREYTDVANMRAAKAAAINALINEEYKDTNIWNESTYNGITDYSAVYDANSGSFTKSYTGQEDAYGQGTETDGGVIYNTTGASYDSKKSYKDHMLNVTIRDGEDEVYLSWFDTVDRGNHN